MNLKEWRLSSKLTLREAADILHVVASTIYCWEAKIKIPGVRSLKLMKKLGIDVTEFEEIKIKRIKGEQE